MEKHIKQESELAYQEALDTLYSYINLEQNVIDRYQASKMDIARPRRLLELLGDPHLEYPSIHIAGTKGKGSVAAMCAAVLRAAGLRVGLYTSPHLRDFRERIRVVSLENQDGRISKGDFATLLNVVKHHLDELPGVTWFEIVTAVAFYYFAMRQVDIAVIEVGLGGRLDATNVLFPLVSVITSLSLDHTNLLGDTLGQIASEKGGIIKPGVPVVIAPQSEEALVRLRDIVDKLESPAILIGRNWQYTGVSKKLVITHSPDEQFVPVPSTFDLALSGMHQLENASVTLAALSSVRHQFSSISMDAIRDGLASVKWEGRLQIVYEADDQPTLLVDSAHNRDSTAKLVAALASLYTYRRLWLIFGAPMDKAIIQMMALLFPIAEGVIVTAADHPRAASPTQLAEQAHSLGFNTIPVETVSHALIRSFQLAEPGDLICATGSIIFVGDLLNQWDSLKSQLIAH